MVTLLPLIIEEKLNPCCLKNIKIETKRSNTINNKMLPNFVTNVVWFILIANIQFFHWCLVSCICIIQGIEEWGQFCCNSLAYVLDRLFWLQRGGNIFRHFSILVTCRPISGFHFIMKSKLHLSYGWSCHKHKAPCICIGNC